MENKVSAAIDKLQEVCGMNAADMEYICGDVDDTSTIFKTMSNGGKRDIEFAKMIQVHFQLKNIPFTKGDQERVFIVENESLIKIL